LKYLIRLFVLLIQDVSPLVRNISLIVYVAER
jgi:hypothetical protein